ncbi:diguanylate cyclase [Roseibacterium sp. SDUM158017]|uniref:diguanylate cyclase n=1 Tax=Roseicyclus salinarum TaxID=3036773 RepID=UPI0024150756|nr:diguanylate cyclase [Roseibacterium sp. SDUM158017]MDG4648609.1 diguanylate cyclase [Roseibacterium sp. SDUM158017]
MTGRILVVDDVATNRIVMKVKLAAACYAVDQADSGAAALKVAAATRPDLVLMDVLMPDMSGLEVCRRLKADPDTSDIPVILVTALSDRASKMAGLEAGADDFLTKPVDEVTLLARVRSLLRARETVRELRERGEEGVGLGFAEALAGFEGQERPGRIWLVAPGSKGAVVWKTALDDRRCGEVRVVPREVALTEIGVGERDAADVFVISADLTSRNDGLRLLSDLRSRPGTRHAATLMVLPEGDTERAAIALDLGASDILYDPVDTQELAIRIRAQLGRKRQADRLRASLRAGLELAVTDSLTGLHNRRYALFQLERMLARPGRSVAVMMLDLDFFKQINDRHGHATGDKVLRRVSRRLRAQLRSGDLLARMGGEEFLVALPDADRSAALDCAERLRRTIAGDPFEAGRDGAPINVTLSVGLALSEGVAGDSPERLIECADRALYGAKSDGRDNVALAVLPAA